MKNMTFSIAKCLIQAASKLKNDAKDCDWKLDVRLRNGWSNVDHMVLAWMAWYYFRVLETPTRRMEIILRIFSKCIDHEGQNHFYFICGLMLWNCIKKVRRWLNLLYIIDVHAGNLDYTAFLHVTVNCQWLLEISRRSTYFNEFIPSKSSKSMPIWMFDTYALFNFAIHCVNIFLWFLYFLWFYSNSFAFTENIFCYLPNIISFH